MSIKGSLSKEDLDTILVLDFGSQYTQLIARRVRELGVYSEIYPWDIAAEKISSLSPKGVILSGGPESVTKENTPRIPEIIFNLDIPILGICYGMQTLAEQNGGSVRTSSKKEFGYAELKIEHSSKIFDGLDADNLDVWMSHGDHVSILPDNFILSASTESAPIAAMEHIDKPYYALQFHPEVTHTNKGQKIIENFILDICKSKKNIQTQITSSSEAEAIKLFSNMYLAMRIAFFNELDSFSLSKNLHSKEIIDGLSSDPRIGNYYNNPSFGYGGYCLPKDTQQLRQNFEDIPQKLIQATIQSNHLRKKFIVNEILKRKAKIIGIYRLSMKTGSDNWRESAIIDIIKSLKREQSQLIIYEPLLSKKTFMGISIENDLEKFKNKSKLIVANRFDGALGDNDEILFTRDIFNEN
jgi:GMP synthase (glutamine-hydrolysing) A subunit